MHAFGSVISALFVVLFASVLPPSIAQSGCSRLAIGSVALPGTPGGIAPLTVTPPPLLSTGDFVVEWWLWMGNVSPYAPVVFEFGTTLAVSISPVGGATLWISGTSASSGYAPVQTTWQHWAVVRNGTSVTLFVAGNAAASQVVSSSTNLTASTLVIGGSRSRDSTNPAPGSLPCLLSEFRVVLNAALYSGPFLPPSQPFDAIQGTALLLHAASPAQLLFDSSPAAAVVEASTGVSWSSAAPFSCSPSGSLSAKRGGGSAAAPPPPALRCALALKLTLNALSTGAHVAKGLVVRNVMANMMLTNEKLFLRAIGIVRDVTGADAEVARLSILRAIHDGGPAASGSGSSPSDAAAAPTAAAAAAAVAGAPWWEGSSVPLDAHVKVAAVTPQVIPVAILLAHDSVVARPAAASEGGAAAAAPLTPAGARDLLRREPRVARAMALLSARAE